MAFRKTSRHCARAAAALLALLPAFGQAATGDEKFDLTVRVVDADPVTGTLEISLFNSALPADLGSRQ
jgi:uncharacterized protein (DUF2141 family)